MSRLCFHVAHKRHNDPFVAAPWAMLFSRRGAEARRKGREWLAGTNGPGFYLTREPWWRRKGRIRFPRFSHLVLQALRFAGRPSRRPVDHPAGNEPIGLRKDRRLRPSCRIQQRARSRRILNSAAGVVRGIHSRQRVFVSSSDLPAWAASTAFWSILRGVSRISSRYSSTPCASFACGQGAHPREATGGGDSRAKVLATSLAA